MNITIKKQVFMLHPFGSLYWKDKNILLISDLHLGKISHFRKNGLAIPNSAIPKNFENGSVVVENEPLKVKGISGKIMISRYTLYAFSKEIQ